MKKMLALLLAMVMLFGMVACGGGEEAPEGGNAPAGQDLEAKYGIKFDGEGEQKMSDERAPMSVLVETRDTWLGGQMTFAFASEPKTYEDFVEHIGCDASYYINMAEDGERHFVWVAEGDETAKFLAVFWETPQGWTLYSVGSTNISN